MWYRSSDSTRKDWRLRHALRGISLIVLVLGCPSIPTPSYAKGPIKKLYFELTLIGLPNQLCVGQTYPLSVAVSSSPISRTDKNGSPVRKTWSGINVSAEVGDTAIATITPAQSKTVLSGAAAPATQDEELPNLPPTPQATFELTPLKAGQTTLTFAADIPQRISHTKPQIVGRSTSIRVVDCKYRLTLAYSLKQREPEYHSDSNGWSKGEIRFAVDPQTYQITGKGTLGSITQGGYKEPLEECEDDLTGIENPVDITGKLENGQLNLKLQLMRAEVQATVHCRKFVPSSWVTMPPEVKRRSLFGPSPVLELQFPTEGGTRTHPSPYPPEYRVDGLFTVTVVPEQAQ